VFPAYPASTEGGKKVSARCTRRRMAHRVGAAGYSSTLRTTMSTRSTHRECSKNYKASLRWRKNHSLRLILSLTVLLLVGVMAVLVLEATNHPGGSSAVHATGEGGTFSSSSSISQLPRTGGP
jgi:hypothetical protein